MNKIVMCLLTACSMMFVVNTDVFAKEQTEASWTVTFNGDELIDDAADNHVLQNNIVLPGDSVKMTTTVTNAYEKATNWYIETKDTKTLLDKEDSFEYELSYNGKVIFASTTIGSAETGGNSNGLGDIEMDGFEWLATLQPNESGTVVLTLKIDPEVQGNTYFETIAELAEVYAVEINEPLLEEHEIIRTVTKKKVKTKTNVLTGDSSGAALGIAAAAFVAGVACMIFAFVRKKKEEDDHE